MDIASLWQAAIAELHSQMAEPTFRVYLQAATLVGTDGQLLTVGVGANTLDWCNAHLRVALERSLSKLSNATWQVNFVAVNSQPDAVPTHSDVSASTPEIDWLQLGIPLQFRDKTIDTLDWNAPALNHAGLRHYVTHLMDYLPHGLGLLLIGPPGIGKTHLVIGLAKRAAEAGQSIAFVDMTLFLKRLRQAGDLARLAQPSNSDLHLIDDLAGVDLLVLDDLHATDLSAWGQARIRELVGRRWDTQRPILATSNFNLDMLAYPKGRPGHDLATLSRLAGAAVVIELRGEDYRPRLKQAHMAEIRAGN